MLPSIGKKFQSVVTVAQVYRSARGVDKDRGIVQLLRKRTGKD